MHEKTYVKVNYVSNFNYSLQTNKEFKDKEKIYHR